MKLREEEDNSFYGHTIGYCNRGPLYGRPAPYIHRAVSNRGELGRALLREDKKNPGRPMKQKT